MVRSCGLAAGLRCEHRRFVPACGNWVAHADRPNGIHVGMPEISRFFGIVIRMYFLDHAPPHFHARCDGVEARFRIQPLEQIDGDLPPRAQAMIMEWAALHQNALLDNWLRLHRDELPNRIAPLE